MITRGKKIVYLGLFALVGAMLACSASAIAPATEETLADPIASQGPAGSDASSEVNGLNATVEPSAVPTPANGNGPSGTPLPGSTSTALPSPGVTVAISPTQVPALTAIPGNRMSDSMFGPIDCEPSSDEIKLTSHIYDPDQFDTITPMGRMWDSHVTPVDHLYFNVGQERPRGMVMTPADGRIIAIERFPNNQSPFWDSSQDEPDIRVIVAHSCDLFSIYIHLGALAPEIAGVVGNLAQGESWHAGPGDLIEVEAGDPIAYDHIDPTQIRVSIGRDIGITQDDCRVCGGVYAVSGNSPDPASVTVADGPIKYELTGRQHASQDSTERTVSNGVVLVPGRGVGRHQYQDRVLQRTRSVGSYWLHRECNHLSALGLSPNGSCLHLLTALRHLTLRQ